MLDLVRGTQAAILCDAVWLLGNHFGGSVSAEVLATTADAFVDVGLKDVGYGSCTCMLGASRELQSPLLQMLTPSARAVAWSQSGSTQMIAGQNSGETMSLVASFQAGTLEEQTHR